MRSLKRSFGQAGTVGDIGTWYAGKIGAAVFAEAIGVEHGYVFVAPAIARVQRVVDVVANMIVECTERSDAQVETFVFEAGVQTEIDLRHTAAQYYLVIGIYLSVRLSVGTAYVLIEAVTNLGAFLCGMVVQVSLCAGDAIINPSVEFADLFTYVGDVGAGDV